jgi:tetratricopeptide (TPR) repeat protein
MRTQTKITLFASIIIVAFLIWKSPKENKIAPLPVKPVKLSKLATSPIPMKVNLPEDLCRSQWETLISAGPYDFLKTVKEKPSAELLHCLNSLPETKNTSANIETYCNPNNKEKFNENFCVSSLYMYRAVLIDLNTKNEIDYANMPLPVLLNKIMSLIIQGDEVINKNKSQLKNMALAAKDMDPNNPSSYKTLAMVDLISDNLKEANEWSDEGLKLDPYDKDLKEAYLTTLAKTDKQKFEEYLSANPNDDMALYNEAYLSWKSGKLDDSKSTLRELIKAHPKTAKYKDTLKMLEANSSTTPFSMSVTIFSENW